MTYIWTEKSSLNLDPSSRKHGGNPQSVDAHERVKPAKRETWARILEYVRSKGSATSKEYAAAIGVDLNCVSGRFSELLGMGALVRTGERRDGAAVLVAIEVKL